MQIYSRIHGNLDSMLGKKVLESGRNRRQSVFIGVQFVVEGRRNTYWKSHLKEDEIEVNLNGRTLAVVLTYHVFHLGVMEYNL